MNSTLICPCDVFIHPRTIFNPPGRTALDYRVGDFAAFRHALLLSLPGEAELTNWRPSAGDDLALQMVEWWAYLADILTFYNGRIANQDYLRTADLPESVGRLIRILGYRPRPAIGARGVLAALISKPLSFTLPQGFQIQSKPGPGKQPQIFELDADTMVGAPDAISCDAPPDPSLVQHDSSGRDTVVLRGTVALKPGDELLFMARGWNASDNNYALATVAAVSVEKDPRGANNTRIVLSGSLGLPAGAQAADYRVLSSAQSAHVWQYSADTVVSDNQVDLEAISRGIKPGDPMLFEIQGVSSAPGPQLVSVTSYGEAIWFANPQDSAHPDKPPSDDHIPAVPIPHSRIGFTASPTASHPASDFDSYRAAVLVRFGWQDAGTLIGAPATTFDGSTPALTALAPEVFAAASGRPLLIEDANAIGVRAEGSAGAGSASLALSDLPSPMPALTPPLRVLFNLLPVSRGASVANEVLGSGDARVAGQEFVLKKSPLTYLQSPDSTSGDNYKSTLRVWVDGLEWTEVASFYGQPPGAQVFVTREDENNQTHVQFGDGVNGARLSSGLNNVVASYRYGSGADSPAAGSLTVVLHPQPNLKAVRNPVAVGGGSDPDPPAKIRAYAPRSVLTFGRAVSGDDYGTIAAQAPGVARARAYWKWDSSLQRTAVTIYVGDDQSAVDSARAALADAGDPNRPVLVKAAVPIVIALNLTLVIDPRRVPADVVAGARAALLDPEGGLMGKSIGIGRVIYDSQIYAACLAAPGVKAVHSLWFWIYGPMTVSFEAGVRHDPGEGGFFQLDADHLHLSWEVAADAA